MALETINPTNGERIREYAEATPAEVLSAISKAHEAFESWRRTPVRQARDPHELRRHPPARAQRRPRPADGHRDGQAARPGPGRSREVRLGLRLLRGRGRGFLAARDRQHRRRRRASSPSRRSGVVLAVMPWNFPLWQVFRFVAPGLMAGNAGLLKHSSNVSGCALAIEEILRDAGFPDGPLPHPARRLLEGVAGIIEAPEVKAVTLTGSTPAGQAGGRQGRARCSRRPCSSSAAAIPTSSSRTPTSSSRPRAARPRGSSTAARAASRPSASSWSSPCSERFEELFVERMRARKMGDPLEERGRRGPAGPHRPARRAAPAGREERGRRERGSLLGGERPAGPGAFYPPTVLTGVKKGMPAYDEELFGPVAAVIAVKDEADAVRVANDSVVRPGRGRLHPGRRARRAAGRSAPSRPAPAS